MPAASSGYGTLIIVAGLDGLGHHVWDFTLAELPNTARLLQASPRLSGSRDTLHSRCMAGKFTIALLAYTYLQHNEYRPVYWACHTLIWGNLVFCVSILFTIIFGCHPIDQVWKLFFESHCINRNTRLVASGAVNVFSDRLNLLTATSWALTMPPPQTGAIQHLRLR